MDLKALITECRVA